jgi:hypothetical protein
VEIVLAVVAVLGLCAQGCASPRVQVRGSASVFQAARSEARRVEPAPGPDEGAAFVARALRVAGVRFGTDGSTLALWGYLRTAHRLVSPAGARPGDILFFDTRGTGEQPACADHVAVVEQVSPSGRIQFLEARGGLIRHSFADPSRPGERRDAGGQLLNTFLRPMQAGDPPEARHLAGQMLCGIARI